MIDLADFSLKLGEKELFSKTQFSFEASKIYTINGDNGTGKSTFFYLLSGASIPYSGSCKINHLERKQLSLPHLKELVSICATSQNKMQIRVRELFDFSQIDWFEQDELLTEFDLKKWEDKSIASLSDGERQWLFIARAIMQNRNIVLLDEPTSFLDRKKRQKFIHLVSDINKQKKNTILINTHDLELIQQSQFQSVILENVTFKLQ